MRSLVVFQSAVHNARLLTCDVRKCSPPPQPRQTAPASERAAAVPAGVLRTPAMRTGGRRRSTYVPPQNVLSLWLDSGAYFAPPQMRVFDEMCTPHCCMEELDVIRPLVVSTLTLSVAPCVLPTHSLPRRRRTRTPRRRGRGLRTGSRRCSMPWRSLKSMSGVAFKERNRLLAAGVALRLQRIGRAGRFCALLSRFPCLPLCRLGSSPWSSVRLATLSDFAAVSHVRLAIFSDPSNVSHVRTCTPSASMAGQCMTCL